MKKLGGSMAGVLVLATIALVSAWTSGPLAAQGLVFQQKNAAPQVAPAGVPMPPNGLQAQQKGNNRVKGRFYPDASSQADSLLRNASRTFATASGRKRSIFIKR